MKYIHAIMNRRRLTLLPLLLIFSLPGAQANQCLALLPEPVSKLGELKICQSSFNGIAASYSCQDYRGATARYRVLYRGGLIPKAVTRLVTQHAERLLWSPLYGDAKRYCTLAPPRGIPGDAEHRGTGVCHAEDDVPVPCSVYEHAAARQPDFHRYIVFYNPAGYGYYRVNGYVAGDNKNAMIAELAYQFGMSLLDTECCSRRAMDYLEYAYRLFPKAQEYGRAYNRARSILAVRDDGAAAN